MPLLSRLPIRRCGDFRALSALNVESCARPKAEVDLEAMSDSSPRKPRGLAALPPERRKAISQMGGKATHATERAHKFTSDEAREAGAKGGRRAQQLGTAHRFTAEEAAEAGRKGGLARKQAAQDDKDDASSTGDGAAE